MTKVQSTRVVDDCVQVKQIWLAAILRFLYEVLHVQALQRELDEILVFDTVFEALQGQDENVWHLVDLHSLEGDLLALACAAVVGVITA